MKKILGVLLAIITVIFVGGKIYTDILVERVEVEYPPVSFVTVENVRLHYLEAGSGPPVVLISGGSGKLQDFSLSPLYELIVNKYRVIIIDRPGLGYSEKPSNEEVSPDVQARLIHAALEKLGVENPIIVGQSWGGVIALAYAQSYSNELSGIVLLGSSPYPRERHTDFFNVIARTPIIGDFILHTLYVPIGRHWVAPAIMEQNKDYFAPLEAVPESYYDSTIELGLRPSHVKASAEETIIIPASLATLVSDLEKVNLPVIIVAGDLDTHAFEQAVRLEQDLPISRVVIVEGANHYLWFSKPEVVMDTIQELWDWSEEFVYPE
ncbi:alpha/beta hydrolase [bacterium]|nr:alpha/beta hydrolase [bacterium]MBU1024824.1 alpha/beta hydrolase [bacterium]